MSGMTLEERFPLLTEAGRKTLLWLQEHPSAPKFNHPCGDRLTKSMLKNVLRYEKTLQKGFQPWKEDQIPSWVARFAAKYGRDVPFYRRRFGKVRQTADDLQSSPMAADEKKMGKPIKDKIFRGKITSDDFFSLPTCSRNDLQQTPWSFVPDSANLHDLIVYFTNGTSGDRLNILSHPEVSTKFLAGLRFILEKKGIHLETGPGKVFLMNVCAQKETYTHATVSSYMGDSGYVKLNLDPGDWKNPDHDRVLFIDDCQPQVFTGDPLAFLALARLPISTRPQALVSSAMDLLPGYKKILEDKFGCPVFDIYSLNECRLIAVNSGHGFEVISPDVFVEILDHEGNRCPSGQRGEITITGGRNPFLPLIRYRTGDFAALDLSGKWPRLTEFQGRPPTVFQATNGATINNIDVANALKPLALAQFQLHQAADGSLIFRRPIGQGNDSRIFPIIKVLFGKTQKLTIADLSEHATTSGKVFPFTSECLPTSPET